MNKHLENSPTVLIVNDDRQQLGLLTDLLEPEGYKVFAAQDAQRALEITALVRTDIIICDVVMPRMDGMELCRRLKGDPRTAMTPVLLVSAVRKKDAALLEAGEAFVPELLEAGEEAGRVFFKAAGGGASRRSASSALSSTIHSTVSPRENSIA